MQSSIHDRIEKCSCSAVYCRFAFVSTEEHTHNKIYMAQTILKHTKNTSFFTPKRRQKEWCEQANGCKTYKKEEDEENAKNLLCMRHELSSTHIRYADWRHAFFLYYKHISNCFRQSCGIVMVSLYVCVVLSRSFFSHVHYSRLNTRLCSPFHHLCSFLACPPPLNSVK